MKKEREILVVDNDPETARRIGNILRSEGYSVSSAATEVGAISTAKDIAPSLIFVSLTMPYGLEICKKIHSIGSFSKIPLIILTSPEKVFKARYEPEYGIVDSLNKSFTPEELIIKTETVLSIKEITETGPERIPEIPEFEPVEVGDISFPSSIPLHEDVEGLIEKSFEPQPEIHSEEVFPVKKKKGFLIPILILMILIITISTYFILQNFGIRVDTIPTQIVKKILPTKPTQPIQPTQPAQPAQPVQPPKLQDTESKPLPKTPSETKPEAKTETQKVVAEPGPEIATHKERHLYSAQVGAFKNIDNAETIVKELKSKGYDAFIHTIIKGDEKGSEKIHKVLVGKYEDKKKADEIVSTLKSKENIKAIIYRSE